MFWIKAALLFGAFVLNSIAVLPRLTAKQQRSLERACQCACVKAVDAQADDELAIWDRWLARDPEIVARWGGGWWECSGRTTAEPR